MSDEPTPHDRHDSHESSDDPTAARLRAALNAEAAMVQPDDHLSTIRERVEEGDRPWWRHPAALAVAAAVVLGLAVGGGAAVLGGGDDPTVVAGGTGSTSASPSTTPASPSDTPSTSEGTATPTAAVPVEGNVFVYYGMAVRGTWRLYREMRPNIGMDPATQALTTLFSEPALDPDYESTWPAGTTLAGYSSRDDVATVELDVPAGAEVDDFAYQQVVYTVTANSPDVAKVRLRMNGETTAPLTRTSRVEVQGLIWLLTPAEGSTVSSPVEIAGYGTAFEGTISWEVRREGSDAVVAEGFTQGGSMGEFADFSDSVALEPGTYEMRALEFSAEDGRPLNVDSKTFTVE